MSDIIQLLPDTVANQIAAGEVIQRPASVIKELVENAVDAGAKQIQIAVVDAGKTSIRVIDDGKGMSETDARLSFERHATSKIRSADDLFALTTMGFRGEALASIAAVAQVELVTRRAEDEVGTRINISGSRVTGQTLCTCPVGSNFKVDNLFYNVPARRKFLKSNATELSNIITAFQRIALVYPDITFMLYHGDTLLYKLPAGGLLQRIVELMGPRFQADLLPVSVETTLCKVNGYVGKPESAKKKGAHQFFFVNGRYMRHPYFQKAVMSAFERLVPQGEQVPFFLYFEVPTADIDVNIHPTKTEIKFENEQAIWQILAATVKEAIGRFNEVPAIDFDSEEHPDIPVFNPERHDAVLPEVKVNHGYNPFTTTSSSPVKRASVDEWQQLYPQNMSPSIPDEDALPGLDFTDETVPSLADHLEKSPLHYQYKGKYVMTAVKSGLMIIDQYRAHVRVMYEQYLKQLSETPGVQQRVLFPEVLRLAPAEELTLQHIMPDMRQLGFDLSPLGAGNFAVQAIPAGLEGINVGELVNNMLTAANEQTASSKEKIHESLALSLARQAAIPYGQILSNLEMEELVNDLFRCPNPKYTPDGKSILYILSQTDIERQLG